MVDETEFEIMDADTRHNKFECDECDKVSAINYTDDIDDETYEAIEAEGWLLSEGVLFCDECQISCKTK